MEIKKNPKADLEKLRGIFLQLGLAVTLGIVLLAFEWTSQAEQAAELMSANDVDAEEEIIPITRQEEIKPPPPPPAPQVIEVLNIVEDDVEIDEEMEMMDSEADEDTEFEIIDMDDEDEEAPVFFIVEEMPIFPGGEVGLRTYISKNVKYPNIARENDIQGKVYVRFVVKSDGNVDKVTIARSVDPILDKEAVRVVKNLPRWKPGKQRGKSVNVWYTVPINFQLQ